MEAARGEVRILPSFALGGYLVFLPTGGTQAMMMGDLVLTETELEPVMLELAQSGVDVTAIHNHLLWEQPTVMYMHVMATGEPAQLAKSVHDALALTRTPLSRRRRSRPTSRSTSIPQRSIRRSARRERSAAASTSSRSRPPSRSRARG